MAGITWRQLDAFEGRDELSLSFDVGTSLTCVTVREGDGTLLARASYSEDSYENTVALTHLEVEGAHQNKGIGSKLLRSLYHLKWQGRFVRIWNPAPRAEKFYRRLGFIKRTSEVEKGEMWFRTTAQATEEWPTVDAKDLGEGARSHLARMEDQAAQAELRLEAAEKAKHAALIRTSTLCSGIHTKELVNCVKFEPISDTTNARVEVVDGAWAGESYEGGWDIAVGKPHGVGTLTYASGKTYSGNFVHGTLQGYGHLVSGHSEYRGAFHANQMHGHGAFKISGERWSRDFRRLGPSLVAARMKHGEPVDDLTENADRSSSSSSPASAEVGGGGIAVWAAGSPELQECLVEQHAKHAPLPAAAVAPSEQGDSSSGGSVGGLVSPSAAAASSSSPSSSSEVFASEAEASARDAAWFQAAPNPCVAYCAPCMFVDGKLVVVGDLAPVLAPTASAASTNHSNSNIISDIDDKSTSDAKRASPTGVADFLDGEPLGSSPSQSSSSSSSSAASQAAWEACNLWHSQEPESSMLSSALVSASSGVTGTSSFLASTTGAAAEEIRASFRAALELKLSRKRSAQAAGLNRVALVTSEELNVLEKLAQGTPMTADWGNLIQALGAWGWSYKTAKFPFTWEWGLHFKAKQKSEEGIVGKAYHKSLLPVRFYNDPNPCRKDDASYALREHLTAHPALWALVLQGPSESDAPVEMARKWVDTYNSSQSALLEAAGNSAGGDIGDGEAKASEPISVESPPAKRSCRRRN